MPIAGRPGASASSRRRCNGRDKSAPISRRWDDHSSRSPRAGCRTTAAHTARQSAIHGDTGLGGVSAPIAVTGATLAFFPDLPLLRDQDAGGDSQHRQYFWAGGYSDGWPGAVVYRSADGVTFSYLAKVPKSQAMLFGLAENALAAPASPWATDTVNTLDVAMLRGEERLASISQDELVNGGNAALLFNPDTGFGEVIQYRDVEELGDGSYRLSNLLRGRRGTDVFCGLHRAGEYLILLDAATAQMVSLPLTDRGATRPYKVATPGQSLETVIPQPRRFRGFDLMPYAPVQPAAVKSGSPQNITVSWIRRTRIGGEWMSGLSEVPLSEASEAYEIDILTSDERRDGQADADGDDAVGALPERADRHRLRRGAGQPQRRPLPDERRRRPRLPPRRNPGDRLIIRDQGSGIRSGSGDDIPCRIRPRPPITLTSGI